MHKDAKQPDQPASALIRLTRALAGSQNLVEMTLIAERIVTRTSWDRAVAEPESTLARRL